MTEAAVRSARFNDKPSKLYDSGGLYLLIKGASKYWRLKYRMHGREKTLAFGVYPLVSLKDARQLRDEAKKQLSKCVDPGELKRQAKATPADTFEVLAREWYAKKETGCTPGHARTIIARLEQNVFPWIGSKPVTKVTAPDVLSLLRRIEARGAIETAHRVQQICSKILRYAVAEGRAERDTAADTKDALAPAKPTHRAAITEPRKVGALMRALYAYEGHFVTRCALKLAALTFVRPGELRQAEWAEFDFDDAEWRIPPAKMKMRERHIVPLCTQAVAVLRELEPLTGDGRFVFPGARDQRRPMSENTVLGALGRLGFDKSEMTGHGFRSMASTLLNEMGCWDRDAIERQLAHAPRNKVRAAYNRAELLPERRRMMQAYADRLDDLRVAKPTRGVPISRKPMV